MVHRDLHQLTRGGICTLYRSLAAQMAARGHAVTLITQATPHPITLNGVEVATLPRTEDLPAHRAAVADLLDRLRPDIIDCSTWEAETLTYLNQPRTRRAPVMVRGEFSAATLGAPDLASDEHELVHRADRVIAVSHYAAGDLASAYGISTPGIVHNGIDRDRFRPGPMSLPDSGSLVTLDRNGQPSDPQPIRALLRTGQPVPPWSRDAHRRTRLLWVGKITPMKGWDHLERIIDRLREIAVVTVLLGHSRARCPVTIEPDRLTVLHDLNDTDLPGLYRSADWLLSTSRWEGFGLAIAEAMASGTPVLLPEQLGTAPELLEAGGGYTYRDADDIARILTWEPRPPAALPEQFDWSVNAEATLAHYRELTQG
ncbi:glycosyltransferase family 4 protein [Polymorphospora rubra]|uniref:glycosyltransferase family 4 protein n=1 Tax=Polymorphospora rubra TaxID=338584 RepID=UPI003400DD49